MTAKSNKLTESDFSRLKSGQTFWRTWFTICNGKIMPHVRMTRIAGKRVSKYHSVHQEGYPAVQFYCKNQALTEYSRFISDMKGLGCFWTKKSCDRFVAEVLSGKHPAVQQKIAYYSKLMNKLDCHEYMWQDDYDYEYGYDY